MNAEPQDKKGYQDALQELMSARPWLGEHTIGRLTISAGHRIWTVTDGKHYRASGSNKTADAMRLGVAKAVNAYIRTHLR
jgi:hypothetical protein